MTDPKYIVTADMASKAACLAIRDVLKSRGIEPRYEERGGGEHQFVVGYEPDGSIEDVEKAARALGEKVLEAIPSPVFYRLPLPHIAPSVVAFAQHDGVGVRAIEDYFIHSDTRIARLDVLIGS